MTTPAADQKSHVYEALDRGLYSMNAGVGQEAKKGILRNISIGSP